jgi:tRNA G37 N-methylase Trm5
MKKYEVVYLEVDEEEFESMCRNLNLNGWAARPENICCTSEQLIEFDRII